MWFERIRKIILINTILRALRLSGLDGGTVIWPLDETHWSLGQGCNSTTSVKPFNSFDMVRMVELVMYGCLNMAIFQVLLSF